MLKQKEVDCFPLHPAPHVHDFNWKASEVKFIPYPSWILKRKTFLFYKCCGNRTLRVLRRIVTKCTICGKENYSEKRMYAYCPTCGGLEYVADRDWATFTGYY